MSVAPPRNPRKEAIKPDFLPVSQQQQPTSELQKTNSYISLTTSALSGLFGTSASLEELAGDDVATPKRPHGFNNSKPVELDLNKANSLLNQNKKNMNTNNYNNTNTKHKISFSRILPFSSISANGNVVKLSMTSILWRYLVLFGAGIIYGQFAKNLHDNQQVSSRVFDIKTSPVLFTLIWGLHGVILSTLLPCFDNLYPDGSIKPAAFSISKNESNEDFSSSSSRPLSSSKQASASRPSSIESTNAAAVVEEEKQRHEDKGGNDWVSILRASTAFIGLAYGVRKLAWESSSQVAFLWTCLNPILWYILDGTTNGFIVSSATAIVETAGFAFFVPSHFPPVASTSSVVYYSVLAWIGSVLFCCSICFGNLGRRLLSN